MILHIHKNSTVQLNIANEFIDYSEHKLKIFGKFNIVLYALYRSTIV